jgi:hypothetical protein
MAWVPRLEMQQREESFQYRKPEADNSGEAFRKQAAERCCHVFARYADTAATWTGVEGSGIKGAPNEYADYCDHKDDPSVCMWHDKGAAVVSRLRLDATRTEAICEIRYTWLEQRGWTLSGAQPFQDTWSRFCYGLLLALLVGISGGGLLWVWLKMQCGSIRPRSAPGQDDGSLRPG